MSTKLYEVLKRGKLKVKTLEVLNSSFTTYFSYSKLTFLYLALFSYNNTI